MNRILSSAFLVMSLATSAAMAGTVQEVRCSGETYSDMGIADGVEWVVLTIQDPSADTLAQLDRAQASKRVAIRSSSMVSDTISGTRIRRDTLVVSAFNAWYDTDVLIPVGALGKDSSFKGKLVLKTGGGNYVADADCQSKILSD